MKDAREAAKMAGEEAQEAYENAAAVTSFHVARDAVKMFRGRKAKTAGTAAKVSQKAENLL